MKKLWIVIVLMMASNVSYAWQECDVNVLEVSPNVNGYVYFKFSDFTSIKGNPSTMPGLDRNMSVALSALMAKKKVKVRLLDSEACGTNAQENWGYIIGYNN